MKPPRVEERLPPCTEDFERRWRAAEGALRAGDGVRKVDAVGRRTRSRMGSLARPPFENMLLSCDQGNSSVPASEENAGEMAQAVGRRNIGEITVAYVISLMNPN